MVDNMKKILIVDDDNFLRQMYIGKFKLAGYEVESCGSTKEALSKLGEGYEPDVLLFDIVMPVEDGWELLKQIQTKGYAKKAKKIVLSNQGEEKDAEIAKGLKVDGYIVKALNVPSEVVEKVEKIFKA